MPEIGVINEIGDLGLGFSELNEKDSKAYEEATKNKSDDTTVINEDNK